MKNAVNSTLWYSLNALALVSTFVSYALMRSGNEWQSLAESEQSVVSALAGYLFVDVIIRALAHRVPRSTTSHARVALTVLELAAVLVCFWLYWNIEAHYTWPSFLHWTGIRIPAKLALLWFVLAAGVVGSLTHQRGKGDLPVHDDDVGDSSAKDGLPATTLGMSLTVSWILFSILTFL